METSFITCVICPKGCNIKVDWKTNEDGSKEVLSVTGNSCSRGLSYATAEVIHPQRVLTSTIRVKKMAPNGETSFELIPIRSASPIPKELMMKAMDVISNTVLDYISRPSNALKMGDTVISNIVNTGIDMISCRDLTAF